MKTIILTFLTIFLNGCIEKYEGEPFGIKNNTNLRVYYWESSWNTPDFTNHHYPDTLLPSIRPVYLNSIGPNNSTTISESDPNYNSIFAQLPEGKYSIYFFTTNPETQQDWDNIRLSYNLIRKDVTLQYLKDNNYVINYP